MYGHLQEGLEIDSKRPRRKKLMRCKKVEIGDVNMWASGWGPDLVWMLRGPLGFILIEPTHPGRTTMVVQHFCAATCSRLQRKEEMEEIGRNGSTNYNTGVSYHFWLWPKSFISKVDFFN